MIEKKYDECILFELLVELKKNIKNKELLKYIKRKINSENQIEIEKIIDTMEKADIYIGFEEITIWRYLGYLDILNFPLNEKEIERVVESLKKNNKIDSLKKFLYYELEDLKKIKKNKNAKNDKLKEKMLKKPEYKVLNAIIDFEEKELVK